MTKEEKDLLLKDLCARLLYGVQVCYKIHLEDEPIDVTLSGLLLDYFNNKTVVEVRPYLRPLLSMTEDEKIQLIQYACIGEDMNGKFIDEVQRDDCHLYVDWLNAHHFDYRGLIEKGLALEAPENMYKID